jgi:hypothetical protein
MPDATQNLKLKITADTSQATGMGGLKGMATAMAAVTAALYTAKQAYKSFIEPVIQYNKEIKDASESTGMATEELSRFIQVGDDMGVEMGKITKALEMGTKNGFAPSIDALAALADKGNAMASTTERAAMYTKIFGRNWAELNPILEMGGKRIREMAAAQADGLVVTEAEIRKSEEARLALDELNDKWLALRNTLVMQAMPAITEATEKQNFWQAATAMNARRLQDVAAAVQAVDRGIEDDLIPAFAALDSTEAAPEVNLTLMVNGREVSIATFWALLNAGINRRFFSDVTGGSVIPSALSTTPAYSGESEKSRRERTGTAFGGDVSAGGSYLVGEHGAERFTPGVSGSVSSASDPLVQEIRRMVRTLPVILRDAVQKA